MTTMPPEKKEPGKSIFDLSSVEADQRMNERLDQLKKEIFAKGLPLTYRDERCPTLDHFIREYEDGRIHLALFDAKKQAFLFVRDLIHG